MGTFHVSYHYTAEEAPNALAAVRELAELLASDPAIPRRGVYQVTPLDTDAEPETIDLDDPQYGGAGYFG